MTAVAPFWSSFGRSQIASAVSTLVDWGVLLVFTEFIHLWYVVGTAAGAFCGACTNFVMNRHWSFQAGHAKWHKQAFRYTLVSLGSLLLNTAGVYVVTEFARLHYMVSVVIISAVVGFFFNYPLFRHFVYRD